MGFLIDTNTAIDYLDDKLPNEANRLIDGLNTIVSIITRMELLSWSNATQEQELILNGFIGNSTILSLSEPIVTSTIMIRKKHRTKLPDAIIAATALANNLTLITRNTKDFSGIENLKVVNPYDMK